jgi:hypothetical protein
LQGIMVKLGKAKDPKGVTIDVTKTYDWVQVYPTEVIHDDGQQTIIGCYYWNSSRNIDVSTTIPIVDNIINLCMIPYESKNVIFCPCWFCLPSYLLFLFWANICMCYSLEFCL